MRKWKKKKKTCVAIHNAHYSMIHDTNESSYQMDAKNET